MSGIDNYEITGFLKPKRTAFLAGTNGTEYDTEWNFPSMPMYQNNSTYNGKCAVWLKSVRIGEGFKSNGDKMRELIHSSNFGVVMKTSSLNQIAINPILSAAGGADAVVNATTDYRVSDTRSNAGAYTYANFPFSFNEQHLRFTSNGVEGGANQTQMIKNADVFQIFAGAVESADGAGGDEGNGKGNNAPAVHLPAVDFLMDNAKLFTFYRNQNVGNMEDAVLINAPWGSRVVCGLTSTRLKKNEVGTYRKAGADLDMADVSCEVRFVIKPLKNEAEYSGMPNDEKERR